MLISLVQLSTKQISIPFGRDGPVSAKLSTDVVLISEFGHHAHLEISAHKTR